MDTKQKASSGDLGKLFGAMAKAQGKYLPLGKTAQGHWGKYSNLQDVYDATRKALAENEISVMQSVSDGGVTTVIGHSSGQHLVFETTWTKQTGMKLLALGGGFTLMRRYAQMAVLNIVGDDDAENKIKEGTEIELLPYEPLEEAEDLVDSLLSDEIKDNKAFLDWRNINAQAIARLCKNKEAKKIIEEAVKDKKSTFK